MRAISVIIALCGCLGFLHAQEGLDILKGPVKGFTAPIFAESGQRGWTLSGDLATPIDGGHLCVEGLRVQAENESSSAAGLAAWSLKSPLAIFSVESKRVSGEASFRLDAEGFTLTAEQWSWDFQKNKGWAKKNVRAVFDEKLFVK